METKLGSLELTPAIKHSNLIAPVVAKALSELPANEEVMVSEIDPTLSDTAAFCEAYNIDIEQAANCVILEAKRGEEKWFAACVVLGSTRADINGLARRTLNARKVSFAPMERAVAETDMEYGAITPIGLPPGWPILIDRAVTDTTQVIIGSGLRGSKLAIPGQLLATLPSVQILDSLGQIKS